MSKAETILAWVVAHRGEPAVDIYLCELSQKMDADVVEDVLGHIRGGYYVPDDPEGFSDSNEDPKEVFANQICKRCYAMKRERKLKDHREHMRKLAEKRGAKL